jgi:hypothetical protein
METKIIALLVLSWFGLVLVWGLVWFGLGFGLVWVWGLVWFGLGGFIATLRQQRDYYCLIVFLVVYSSARILWVDLVMTVPR